MREQRCLNCGYVHLVVDQLPLLPIVACGQCPDVRLNPELEDWDDDRESA